MRLVLSWFLSVQLYYTFFVSDGFFAAFSSLVTSPTLDLSDSRIVSRLIVSLYFFVPILMTGLFALGRSMTWQLSAPALYGVCAIKLEVQISIVDCTARWHI
jgi:hypothetical protein